MNAGDAIFVAGHRGMVGSALLRLLRARGFTNLLLRIGAETRPVRPGGILDVSRLAKRGWRPRIGLEEGLRSTYAWWMEQGKRVD